MPQTRLVDAIRAGNLALVNTHLAAGDDVNHVSQVDGHEDATPLHVAVMEGRIDIVQRLLEVDASLDARTAASGSTPLHYAVYAGNTKIVNILLEAGASTQISSTQRLPLPAHRMDYFAVPTAGHNFLTPFELAENLVQWSVPEVATPDIVAPQRANKKVQPDCSHNPHGAGTQGDYYQRDRDILAIVCSVEQDTTASINKHSTTFTNAINRRSSAILRNFRYQEAIEILNAFQIRAQYLKLAKFEHAKREEEHLIKGQILPMAATYGTYGSAFLASAIFYYHRPEAISSDVGAMQMMICAIAAYHVSAAFMKVLQKRNYQIRRSFWLSMQAIQQLVPVSYSMILLAAGVGLCWQREKFLDSYPLLMGLFLLAMVGTRVAALALNEWDITKKHILDLKTVTIATLREAGAAARQIDVLAQQAGAVANVVRRELVLTAQEMRDVARRIGDASETVAGTVQELGKITGRAIVEVKNVTTHAIERLEGDVDEVRQALQDGITSGAFRPTAHVNVDVHDINVKTSIFGITF